MYLRIFFPKICNFTPSPLAQKSRVLRLDCAKEKKKEKNRGKQLETLTVLICHQ